jgi:hypothetical protein
MKTKKYDAIVLSSKSEKEIFDEFIEAFKNMPLPDDEILPNLGLFLTSKNLSRLLFFYELYKKLRYLHGSVIEFGVRWGQNLSLLSALRGIYEPFNRHRLIVGFDTFKGFKGVAKKDGKRSSCKDGSFAVPPGYETYLEKILSLQEATNPLSHIRRFELIKGDATKTVPAYFKKNPHTIVAMAIFDFDIYKPTKAALAAIKPHLCKGSILVFDELNDPYFPGETLALKEVLGLRNVKVRRMPRTVRLSYVEVE